MSHILIVEDELKLASIQADYLHNAGYTTDVLDNGLQVLPWIQQNPTDLILLDLMLPGCDGLDICKQLRAINTIPIIIVTSRIEEIDRLLGLELGADDYICKPYSPRELGARVKAVLRRLLASKQILLTPSKIKLDLLSYRVIYAEQSIGLTSVEFQLFQAMFSQPGCIFSRSKLMDLIYHDQRIVSDRTIDSHIKKLRKKLADLLPDQEIIHSVYGAGYRYEQQE